MDLSGMIFVALAVVWAVYLIPRAVNRSEDELALAPADVTPDTAEAPTDDQAGEKAPTRLRPLTRAERSAVRLAVSRRRRVLLTLVGLTVGTVLLGILTPVPVWVAAVPGVLVLAWLAVCRVQVRRLEASRAARLIVEEDVDAPTADAAQIEVDQTTATTEVDAATAISELVETHGAGETLSASALADAADEVRIAVPDSPAALVVEPDEDTVGLSEADREAALADEMPRGAVWDPRPLTLPTYIAKPRARRTPRELDPAGVSSSARDAGDSRLVAEGAMAGVDATARPREAVGS